VRDQQFADRSIRAEGTQTLRISCLGSVVEEQSNEADRALPGRGEVREPSRGLLGTDQPTQVAAGGRHVQ
jgi:hypothetical protein